MDALLSGFPFLLPLDLRMRYFRSLAFGVTRSVAYLQQESAAGVGGGNVAGGGARGSVGGRSGTRQRGGGIGGGFMGGGRAGGARAGGVGAGGLGALRRDIVQVGGWVGTTILLEVNLSKQKTVMVMGYERRGEGAVDKSGGGSKQRRVVGGCKACCRTRRLRTATMASLW